MQPKPALPRWRIRTNLQEGLAREPHTPQVQGHRRQGRLVREKPQARPARGCSELLSTRNRKGFFGIIQSKPCV